MFKILFYTMAFWGFTAVARAEDAAAQLLVILKPVQNLSGHFDQQAMDKNGKVLQQQSGSFVVQKSGEFVWHVLPPYEQHIISDGKLINIYDPDLEQLTIKALDQKAQVIPLLLFSENGQHMIRQYEVSRAVMDSPGEMAFELKPRQAGSLFDKLVIVFAGRVTRYTPTQLDIVDSLKQNTRVRFDQVLLNQSIDQKLFEFSAPAGVDVIDERH